MRRRPIVIVVAGIAAGITAFSLAQTTPVEPAATVERDTRPATTPGAATATATRKAVDRSTPRAALAAYLAAQHATDAATLDDLLVVTDPGKQQYVQIVTNWMLWSRYLERAAVQKFGHDEGMSVFGNLRTAEDQFAIDQKRLPQATVEYAPDRRSATLFLKVEPNRPAGLQTDRFSFLDRYMLLETPDGWRVDFLKTYDCADPEKDELYRFEARVFPLLATAMKDLADKLAAGDFSSAAQLKAALDARTDASYTGKPAK
jgi:hypothetical protein